MKKILILGAGMVSKPIVVYLLNKGYQVTLGDLDQSKAQTITANHPNATAIHFDVKNEELLNRIVLEHDITVSLLPWVFHPTVAKYCLAHKKNMVTTSYVKQQMQDLDEKAKEAGILLLNEIGLDPGIDHMSAMRIIDHIHGKGGKVDEFYSFCGALVAPEVEKNPFNYKFTWAPKGVVMAGNNNGKYLMKGKVVDVPTEDLFKKPIKMHCCDVGDMEVYPNRDSLPYLELYGIPEAQTMMRGTFRYSKWCEVIDAFKKIGLLGCEKMDMQKLSYAQMLANLIGADNAESIQEKVANFLGIDTNSNPMVALEWLGLFSSKTIGRDQDSPFEVVSDIMIDKMMIKDNERDMVVMQHTFVASYPNGEKEVIRSRMLDFGTPKTDTSIARTVALPAACAVEMILENKIQAKGVHIPVIPEIYNPILDTLEDLDIKMIEEFGLPLSENIC
ncbi:saccharopine dehydrogenase C-terminal domain-containing protein [Perlabentimonas gracilis]|uniref:saccharopine dehydrogenase C-terminal domain-containing protein n=1 Tax=Perlabentimonas gracilis TaxID=2715279 RepID=UPI00140BAEE4|nr:saccharopine dehydrogenase C-terminal domain-containing protein [Perlabentimonas gracilis]NHB69704.1 saccharopine dehydrogenase [Perlabentimonas gracilis]